MMVDGVAFSTEIAVGTRHFDLCGVAVDGSLSLTWRYVTDEFEANDALSQSEERFRLLAQNSTDVVVHARRGLVEWVSSSLARALGWEPKDWVGHSLEEYACPTDGDTELEPGHAVAEDGETRLTRMGLRHRDSTCHGWTSTPLPTSMLRVRWTASAQACAVWTSRSSTRSGSGPRRCTITSPVCSTGTRSTRCLTKK